MFIIFRQKNETVDMLCIPVNDVLSIIFFFILHKIALFLFMCVKGVTYDVYVVD